MQQFFGDVQMIMEYLLPNSGFNFVGDQGSFINIFFDVVDDVLIYEKPNVLRLSCVVLTMGLCSYVVQGL